LPGITHRAIARLARGCALILTVTLSGCATPQYADVSVPKTNFHFQIPRLWDQIPSSSLASALKATDTNTDGAAWVIAYEAGPQPTATDWATNSENTRPFVFALYGKLSYRAHLEMSDEMLRDYYLPVTATARRQAIAQGFPYTDFRQIRDQELSLGDGTQGVRETYDYTVRGRVNTFDEDIVTNADDTVILGLVIHCTATCYSSYRTDIDFVMTSLIQG
jgi:hypothetical protein